MDLEIETYAVEMMKVDMYRGVNLQNYYRMTVCNEMLFTLVYS